MEDSMGGCGIRPWASGKDTSDTEPPVPMEETWMMEECQGALDKESAGRVPKLEVEEETQGQDMTLDEWENLREHTRPEPEFNIQKPESTVPSKSVVIHRSRYRDDVMMFNYEDESHAFWKAANVSTSPLETNSGNLPHPGWGARGSTQEAKEESEDLRTMAPNQKW